MTRLHPFDFVFGTIADSMFPTVRSETEAPGPPISAFVRLRTVQYLLDEIAPEEEGERPPAVEAYIRLLFAAYRFWEANRPTAQITREALETGWNAPPEGPPPAPAGAVYLQLPERWFWGRIDEGVSHEPLDGLFVVPSFEAGQTLVLAVLGLHAERLGFSQLTAVAGDEAWDRARESVRDPVFAPAMAGGDAAGFHSIVSEGELLHLAHLALVSARQ